MARARRSRQLRVGHEWAMAPSERGTRGVVVVVVVVDVAGRRPCAVRYYAPRCVFSCIVFTFVTTMSVHPSGHLAGMMLSVGHSLSSFFNRGVHSLPHAVHTFGKGSFSTSTFNAGWASTFGWQAVSNLDRSMV